MDPEEFYEDHDESPVYRDPKEIGAFELSSALDSLHLIGSDPYMRMQAFNLSVVDKFIMDLEYNTLRKLNEEDSTPVPEATFLSAQSQMWIFAAYELLRTSRARAIDVLKLLENGGLRLKIESLEKDVGFLHVGRKIRAAQLRNLLDDPSIPDKIKVDNRITHIPFARLAHIRVALAKHEVQGKKKSIALAPGYGRINQWCGSLDYELERGGNILGNISRRDIADELRAISQNRGSPPTDEDIESFDTFMRGPSSNYNPFEEE